MMDISLQHRRLRQSVTDEPISIRPSRQDMGSSGQVGEPGGLENARAIHAGDQISGRRSRSFIRPQVGYRSIMRAVSRSVALVTLLGQQVSGGRIPNTVMSRWNPQDNRRRNGSTSPWMAPPPGCSQRSENSQGRISRN